MAPNFNADVGGVLAEDVVMAPYPAAILPGAAMMSLPEFFQPQLAPTPVFVDGFQNCGDSALRYLLEVEGLSLDHPLVEGLRRHILEVQERLGLNQLPFYHQSPKHLDHKPWQPWVDENDVTDEANNMCQVRDSDNCLRCGRQTKQFCADGSSWEDTPLDLSSSSPYINSCLCSPHHTTTHFHSTQNSSVATDSDVFTTFSQLYEQDSRVAQATDDLINVLNEELTPEEVDLIDMDILADDELM